MKPLLNLLNLLLVTPLISSILQEKPFNRLFDDLLSKYNKIARPAQKSNETIRIEFKFKLDMLVDVHERDQVLTTNGWLTHKWHDYRLEWDPISYGGVTKLHIPGEMLWLPDIILYNNAHGSPSVSAITYTTVTYDGIVTWQPPVIYHSFCNIDIEWYPYDKQKCELKFGSWTYSGTQLDMRHPRTDDVQHVFVDGERVWQVERGIDISDFQDSVEWDLLAITGTRHEKWYPCCDYPSIDITYYLFIRRKKLFYTVNLVIPCISLAALTSYVFYLPCESHQKIQLCISILVSLTVFFLLLTEIIPPTSLVTPLIVKYLSFTTVMVSFSIISTVIVQNIHFRTSKDPMAPWMRKLFIDTLGPRLLISRKTEAANFHRKAKHDKQINALSAMSILQHQFQKTVFEIEMATKAKKPLNTVNALFLELPMMTRSKSMKPNRNSVKPRKKEQVRRLLSSDLGRISDESDSSEQHPPGTVRNKLRRAEKNVHYIAETLTDRRTNEEANADWQFVSMVVDRILLIIFGTTILSGTLLATLSAPSISDTTEPITMVQ